MNKFEQLVAELKQEQTDIITKLNEKSEKLNKKLDAVDKKTKELVSREEKLEEKEKGFEKKAIDINRKAAKLMTEEQLREKMNEVETLIGQNQELVFKAQNFDAEAGVKLEEVAKRERAVAKREKNYEEEIRKKFANKLLK